MATTIGQAIGGRMRSLDLRTIQEQSYKIRVREQRLRELLTDSFKKMVYEQSGAKDSVSVEQAKVSEKSDRNVWRITDREEVQSLGLLDKETTIELFKRAIGLFKSKELGRAETVGKNIKLSYQKIMGWKCVQVENTLVGSSFNINLKTATGALRALGVDPDEE